MGQLLDQHGRGHQAGVLQRVDQPDHGGHQQLHHSGRALGRPQRGGDGPRQLRVGARRDLRGRRRLPGRPAVRRCQPDRGRPARPRAVEPPDGVHPFRDHVPPVRPGGREGSRVRRGVQHRTGRAEARRLPPLGRRGLHVLHRRRARGPELPRRGERPFRGASGLRHHQRGRPLRRQPAQQRGHRAPAQRLRRGPAGDGVLRRRAVAGRGRRRGPFAGAEPGLLRGGRRARVVARRGPRRFARRGGGRRVERPDPRGHQRVPRPHGPFHGGLHRGLQRRHAGGGPGRVFPQQRSGHEQVPDHEYGPRRAELRGVDDERAPVQPGVRGRADPPAGAEFERGGRGPVRGAGERRGQRPVSRRRARLPRAGGADEGRLQRAALHPRHRDQRDHVPPDHAGRRRGVRRAVQPGLEQRERGAVGVRGRDHLHDPAGHGHPGGRVPRSGAEQGAPAGQLHQPHGRPGGGRLLRLARQQRGTRRPGHAPRRGGYDRGGRGPLRGRRAVGPVGGRRWKQPGTGGPAQRQPAGRQLGRQRRDGQGRVDEYRVHGCARPRDELLRGLDQRAARHAPEEGRVPARQRRGDQPERAEPGDQLHLRGGAGGMDGGGRPHRVGA